MDVQIKRNLHAIIPVDLNRLSQKNYQSRNKLNVFSGFRRVVEEIFAILGCYVA